MIPVRFARQNIDARVQGKFQHRKCKKKTEMFKIQLYCNRSRSNSIPRTRPIPRSPPMNSKTSSNHNRVNSHHQPSHGNAKKISGSSHHIPHHHQQQPPAHHPPQHSQHHPSTSGGVRSVRPIHPSEAVRGVEDKMRMAGSSRPHREEKVSVLVLLNIYQFLTHLWMNVKKKNCGK